MLSIVIVWLSAFTVPAYATELFAVKMGHRKKLSNYSRFVHWLNWVSLPLLLLLCILISIVIACKPSAMLTHKDVWGTLADILYLNY